MAPHLSSWEEILWPQTSLEGVKDSSRRSSSWFRKCCSVEETQAVDQAVDQVGVGGPRLAAVVPVVRRSRFWRHWGTKTVMFRWPRLQKVSTASAIPRQEKKR